MRLLFVHDHRFYRGSEGRLHTAGSFPSEVWDRYLRHFDEILVLARNGGALPSGSTLGTSNHSSVSFEFAPDVGSLRHAFSRFGPVRKQMHEALARCDALVARLPSQLGLAAAEVAREIGKPYAVELVGCAWDGYMNHGALAARAYAPLFFHQTRRAVLSAPLVLYVTREWLQGRYPTRGFSAFASNVEIVPLDEDGRRNRERRLRELREGRRPKLGTIAALTMRTKGVQTAIASLSELHREGLDLDYALLGPGDTESWQALARNAGIGHLVHFDGTRAAGAGVRDWLDAIDIHLQPSFQEGLPRATIEAMSRGVACIGSTCGGIPELLSPDRTHRPGDVQGLADCIRRLACEPANIERASVHGLSEAKAYLPHLLRERRDEIYSALRRNAERSPPRSSYPS